ncbi:LTA synthase family protein [Dyella humicola]|uniref:LTA synthase family protein n=1 Tax=Dyella humicola TaxID=2992126 RepID=UPI002255BFA5|nr:LTA synthase family protein [Dyella humicola]
MTNWKKVAEVLQLSGRQLRPFFGIAFVIAACLILVLALDPAMSPFPGWRLLWLNVLPIMLVALVLFGISGRAWLSAWIIGGVVWLLFVVNGIKERNMNAPVMPSDVVLESQLIHNLGFFSRYLQAHWLAAFAALAFLAGAWVMGRLEHHRRRPVWGLRLLCILLPMTGLYGIYEDLGPCAGLYSDDALDGFELWNPIVAVDRVGLMAGLVRMAEESKVAVPHVQSKLVEDYARVNIDDLKARAARAVPKELPDIVVVQSEAFFDPGILKGIEPGDYEANFEGLSSSGISGFLKAPTYGGGTIRTEFEALTGYPMQAFPVIEYPYYGLAARWMPSVPRRLDSFGYETMIFHPYHGSFWNRDEAVSALGMRRSFYDDQFSEAERAGVYVSDHALFDSVLTQLDQKASGPRYALVITIENHGPWDGDIGELSSLLDGRKVPAGLSPAATQEMTYYLSHLVNGDKALGDFAQRLLARPQWTVLLFYGDHLPALEHAFAERGFDDGGANGEERTRYVLVSNRPIEHKQRDLSAYELPGLLFDYIGLPEDGYLAFSASMRQKRLETPSENEAQRSETILNAARMEVLCGHSISLAGRCDAP